MRLAIVTTALAVTVAVALFQNVTDRETEQRAALLSSATSSEAVPAWVLDFDGEMRARYDDAVRAAYPQIADAPSLIRREVLAAFWIQNRDRDLETIDIAQKAAFLVEAVTYEEAFRSAVGRCAADDMDAWRKFPEGGFETEFYCVPRGEGLSEERPYWAKQDLYMLWSSVQKSMNTQEAAASGSGRLNSIEVSQ